MSYLIQNSTSSYAFVKKRVKRYYKRILGSLSGRLLGDFHHPVIIRFRAKLHEKTAAHSQFIAKQTHERISVEIIHINLGQVHLCGNPNDLSHPTLLSDDHPARLIAEKTQQNGRTLWVFEFADRPGNRYSRFISLYQGNELILSGQYIDHLLAEENRLNHVMQIATLLPANDPVVDIVMPVFNNFDTTTVAIESVLASQKNTGFRLLVIYDQGDSPALLQWLHDKQQSGALDLLVNVENLGFVKSANIGLRQSPARDVLLLNADTKVSDYFLDRLRGAAYQDDRIATVTPLSNNASIFSFPKSCINNVPSDTFTQDEINEALRTDHAGEVVDVPTGHGFCWFIKRSALNRAGLLDEKLWGRGYCEENDFSRKTFQLGYRHVAAMDTYVEHQGSASFGEEAFSLIDQNLKKMDILYPDYRYVVHQFIAADPMMPYRTQTAKKLIQSAFRKRFSSDTPTFLLVSHHLGGGTTVHVDSLIKKLDSEGIHILLLQPLENNKIQLSDPHTGMSCSFHDHDHQAIRAALEPFNHVHTHVHHLIGFRQSVFQLLSSLGTLMDFTCHDYYSLCPRVNMTDSSGNFCNSSHSETCNLCISQRPLHTHNQLPCETIEQWRADFNHFLSGCRKVFAPSTDTANRINTFTRLPQLEVKSHPEALNQVILSGQQHQVKVAVPGAISKIKGLEVLHACATYAHKEALPIEFTVIGFTSNNARFKKLPNVRITGKYRQEDVHRLLTEQPYSVSAIFSLWPETYSYTLSESLQAGLPVLCFDTGAQAERIKGLRAGKTLPLKSSPKTICETLLAMNHDPRMIRISQKDPYPSLLRDYYDLPGLKTENTEPENASYNET